MLNADSSTLKSESEHQSRNEPPMMPSVAALSLHGVDRASTIWATELDGKIRCSSRDERARLVGPAGKPEQREREEGQGQEREQREVGDHRREVRAAVGEELGEGA